MCSKGVVKQNKLSTFSIFQFFSLFPSSTLLAHSLLPSLGAHLSLVRACCAGDELRQKIETERSEIERLHQEMAELREVRDDLYSQDSEDSEEESSSSSEDEEELQETLASLIRENQQLEVGGPDRFTLYLLLARSVCAV